MSTSNGNGHRAEAAARLAAARDAVPGLPPMGERHYRSWVGPPEYYDRIGVLQFMVLVLLGMREHHTLLDIGCGSLRGGRFSVMYLQEGHYYGLEPEAWVVRDGIAHELSEGLSRLKRPHFAYNDDFEAGHFGVPFDFVLASGIFMHASRRQIAHCFRSAEQVLAEDGVFVGAYLEGSTDSDGDGWTYPEIQRYSQRGLRALAESEGLRVQFMDWPHTFDHRWFVATRQGSRRPVPEQLDLQLFSWTEYLREQVRLSGGTPLTYDQYLQQNLVAVAGDRSGRLLPQALEPLGERQP